MNTYNRKMPDFMGKGGQNLPEDCNNEVPTKLFRTKLVYTYSGRNAWNSTWVEYKHPDIVAPNLEAPKAWVEGKRVQGTVWTLLNVPALVLVLKQWEVVFVYHKRTNEYPWRTSISDPELRKPFIGAITSSCDKSHEVAHWVLPRGTITPKYESSEAFKSKPIGPDYRLEWEPIKNVDLSAFERGFWYLFEQFFKSYENGFFGIFHCEHSNGIQVNNFLKDKSYLGHFLRKGDIIKAYQVGSQRMTLDNEFLDFKVGKHKHIRITLERNGKEKEVVAPIKSFQQVYGLPKFIFQ